MSKSVSLILGSGGARGYAHIGVIEELISQGYEIESISGCSMGALIGAMYATGNLENYKKWVLDLDLINVFSLVDLTFAAGGIIKGEKVFEKIEPFFDDKKIEELDIKFTAVATDLNNKKEVWFQDGDLKTAIRASIAIPTVFTPVVYGDKLLVDGGVLNPLPIAPTMSDRTELKIAVNLNAKATKEEEIAIPENESEKQNKATKFMNSLLDKIKRSEKKKKNETSQIEILNRALETMQESLTKYKVAGYTPDIVINIPIDSCRTYDFHKAYQMIEIGRKLTAKALAEFKSN